MLRNKKCVKQSLTVLFHVAAAFPQCVPWLHGNEEACRAVDLGTVGTKLHVGLHGYRGFSGVSLTCTVSTGPTAIKLERKQWTLIEGQHPAGSKIHFTCNVPTSGFVSDMVVKIRNRDGVPSSGNANLYVSIDRDPVVPGSGSGHDCARTSSNNGEKCRNFDQNALNAPGDQVLYITVYAKKDFEGVEIKCSNI